MSNAGNAEMEKIASACLKYQLVSDPGVDKFVSGPSHGYCVEWLHCMDIFSRDRIESEEVRGFMTTAGRFVTRPEAYDIAEAAGQIILGDSRRLLYSYNVRFSE